MMKVYFLDNTYKGLSLTATNTVDQILEQIASKLDLKDREHFALYQVYKEEGTIEISLIYIHICLRGSFGGQ